MKDKDSESGEVIWHITDTNAKSGHVNIVIKHKSSKSLNKCPHCTTLHLSLALHFFYQGYHDTQSDRSVCLGYNLIILPLSLFSVSFLLPMFTAFEDRVSVSCALVLAAGRL